MHRADPTTAARTTPRIAIFLQNLAGGGAERMILRIAAGLADRQIAVDLVVARAEGEYLRDIPDHVRLVDLGGRRVIECIPELARYLRRERPSALLSALVHVNIAAIVAARCSGRSLRVVISERNTISLDSSSPSTFAVRVAHWLVPWLYPKADKIIAVSAGVADDLAAFSGLPIERIEVINNPVITPDLLRLASEAPRHPWLSAAGPPVILGVGRLSAQKDFKTLLDAFSRVRRVLPARLIVLGEGGERAELEDQVKRLNLTDSVDFPGFSRNPYAFMARASVFVLSSRWEGSPNALVEAMACGAPVVATDCPSGPTEILCGGKYGRLVTVGDPDALAKAVLDTLGAPPSAEVLRQRASDFGLERSVDAYLNVLLG